MEKKRIPAKIIRPVISDVLLRERLFRQIDQLRDFSSIWVSSPGGAGKTTLISSYIDTRSIPSIWYQLDSGDEDPGTFFHYLGLACESTATDEHKSLPQFTPEYFPGLENFSRFFFSELSGRLPAEIMLVFDNCQEIEDDCLVYQAILAGQTRLEAGMNVVFISRKEAPPAFTRQKINRERGDIGWKNLRFTLKEFDLLAGQYGLHLEEHQLTNLYNMLDGWVAGLPLLSGAGVTKLEIALEMPYLSKDSATILFDYFAEEIFRHLDHQSRHVLLRTCFLPFIDAALANRLSGSDRAFSFLQRLHRQNIFISRSREPHEVYQYHQLFREFLLDRCKRVFSTQELDSLRNETAGQLIAAGQIEDGAALLIDAGNYRNLAALVVDNAAVLLRQGRFQTVSSWLQCIPEGILAEDPWLLYWQGMCLMMQEPVQAHSFFDSAHEIFRLRMDSEGMIITLCGIAESMVYGFNSFHALDGWIEKVEILDCSQEEYPSVEGEIRITAMMLAALAMRNPAHSCAKKWRSKALRLLDRRKEVGPEQKVNLLNQLILYDILTGNLAEVNVRLQSFKSLVQTNGMSHLYLITLKNFEALHNWRCGNVKECQRAATEGLRIASETGIRSVSDPLMVNGACGALIANNGDLRDKYLNELRKRLSHTGNYVKQLYNILEGWKCLQDNNNAMALAHGENALRYGRENGSPESMAGSLLLNAVIRKELMQYQEAADVLQQALECCREGGSLQIEFACRLFQVELLLFQGKRSAAIPLLQEALSMGRQKDYYCFPLWRSDAMAWLCHHALEVKIEVEYVRCLIHHHRLIPPASRQVLENWPWPLRIYCLGRFAVVRQGEAGKPVTKKLHKPLSLLKLLIAQGGRNVAVTRLAELLWPESDGDMQIQSFYTTLHRLRKYLDVKDVLILHSGELTLNNNRCWVDVWSFERLVNQATNMTDERGAIQIDLKLAEKAISLYQGQFLASETESWVIPEQERLKRKITILKKKLGDHYS